MKKPLVTAIVTTYKRPPETVERAIKSIEAQTYDNIEIIVVDDSPEAFPLRAEVEKTVSSHDGVRYIAHEVNKGAQAARNTGLNAASGEYVAYLDDDDEWDPTKTEKQLAAFTKESIGLVYCGCVYYNGKSGESSVTKFRWESGMIFDKLIYNNFVGGVSFPLMRKSALVSVGGFDEELQSAQDFDMWLRMAKEYEVNYVPENLVIYHTGEGESITVNPKKKISGKERMMEKYSREFSRNPKLLWIHTSNIIPYYIKDGRKKDAWKTLRKCIKLQPLKIKENGKYLLKIIAR